MRMTGFSQLFILMILLTATANAAAEQVPIPQAIDDLHRVIDLARQAAQAEDAELDQLAWVYANGGGMLQAVGDPRGNRYAQAANDAIGRVVVDSYNAYNIRAAQMARPGWLGDIAAIHVVLDGMPARAHRLEAMWTAGLDGLGARQPAMASDFCDLLLAEWKAWVTSPDLERIDPEWSDDGPIAPSNYDYMATEILAKAGRFDDALAVAGHSSDALIQAECYFVIAVEYAWQGRDDAARALLASTLAMIPEQQNRPDDEDEAYFHDSVWSSAAHAHAALGQYAEAQAVIDAIQDVSSRAWAMMYMADHQFMAGQTELAEATIRQALAIYLSDPDAEFGVVDALCVWGRWAPADAPITWIQANAEQFEDTFASEQYVFLATGLTEAIRRRQSP